MWIESEYGYNKTSALVFAASIWALSINSTITYLSTFKSRQFANVVFRTISGELVI